MPTAARGRATSAEDPDAPLGVESIGISDAEFERVRALAMRLAGISIAASKKALIVGRWGRRLAHHRLRSFGEYLDFLDGSAGAEERQIALDLLTTNETSFFREPKHFDFLRSEVIAKAGRGGRLRIWSAACSSGEEPYSIAMLLAAELEHVGWEVLATDISTRVLRAASAGLYDLTRAESIPKDYLRRFCLKGTGPQAGKFLIERKIRDRVQFAQANLNEPLPDHGLFDAILLRNVMIYFDTATKQRVVGHLTPHLKAGGYFIIGHCDTLAGVSHGLATCSTSVYRKP